MSYFEIGIYNSKWAQNMGTLWRSAYQLGAAGVFTIGKRYKNQPSDTLAVFKQIPLRNYKDFNQFHACLPEGTVLVAIEQGGTPLSQFDHPKQAIYLLGAEDTGLSREIVQKCHATVSLEASTKSTYNVAVAGSIVLYHRVFGMAKSGKFE
jgi:tRNA G18 (ribose-2'-O)-methylase SpoU